MTQEYLKVEKRKRISSNFNSLKIFFVIISVFVLIIFIQRLYEQKFTEKDLIILVILALVFGSFFFYISTLKTIDFNFNDRLFIIDRKHNEEQVLIEKIDKIIYSAIGLSYFNGWSYSYRIVYTDQLGKIRRIRIFPKNFHDDIETLIKLTKLKNPNVKIRNWSMGIQEFYD